MKKVIRLFFIYIFLVSVQALSGGKAYGQICTLIGDNGSDQETLNLCAPAELKMLAKFKFMGTVNPAWVRIKYEWDDGQETIVLADYDPVKDVYFKEEVHEYPKPEDHPKCTYSASAYIVYGDPATPSTNEICTSTRQRQVFANWGTDEEMGGDLNINPENYRVCWGSGFSVNFSDVSQFNCMPAVEPDKPNQLTRWVQFVYGSGNPTAKIPNVTLHLPDGTTRPLTDGSGNMINYTAITGTQFFEGPVIAIPVPVTGPNQTSYTISAPAGVEADVDKIYEITLRNWNICNPYEDKNGVLTGEAPIITRAKVIIVEQPIASARITRNSSATTEPIATKFCPGDEIFFNVNTAWYSGSARRNSITFHDGPSELYPIIDVTRFPIVQNRNFSTSFSIPNNTTPGIKTIVIEARDRNTNGGGANCINRQTYQIEIIDAPRAGIVYNGGNSDIDFCKLTSTDKLTLDFGDDGAIFDPSTVTFTYRFININNNTETVVGPSTGAFIDPDLLRNIEYSEPGAYKVIFTAKDINTGCGTSDELLIGVHLPPVADFEIESQTVYCAKKEITFKDLSKDFDDISNLASDEIILRRWYFDYDNDPTAFTDYNEGDVVAHTYTTPGTYKVRLEVESGFPKGPDPLDPKTCGDALEKEITIDVFPSPEADFTIPPPNCPGTFTFTNNSVQPAGVTPVRYFWVISDENDDFILEREGNDATFDYIFTNDQSVDVIYKVRLKTVADNQCEFVSPPQDVTVNPAMPAKFSSDYDPFNPNCTPVTIPFTVDHQTTTLDVKKYIWTITNNSSGTTDGPYERDKDDHTFIYTFSNTTNSVESYVVSLQVELNTPYCVNPYQQQLRINPVPTNEFNIDGGTESCDYFTLKFDATSKGLTYIWNISGAPENNPARDDNFDLVFKRPEAGDGDLTVTATLETINATNCRSGVSDPIDFIIPQKSDIDVILSVSPGTASEGCDVYIATFVNNTIAPYPADTEFELRVAKDGGSEAVKAIDAGGDILSSFDYTFEGHGTYVVTLRATAPDGCTFDSPPVNITVYPAVTAAFTGDDEVCSENNLVFQDQSTIATNALSISIDQVDWTVRNKQTGASVGPVSLQPGEDFEYEFTNTSNVSEEFDVVQTAFSNSTTRCSNTITKTITVYPVPKASFDPISTPICAPYEVAFRNNEVLNNPPGTTYRWVWGDGTNTIDTDEEPTMSHVYFNSSNTLVRTRKVTLFAISPEGCQSFMEHWIDINPRVDARIEADKISGCAPLEVNFTNHTRGNSGTDIWEYRREGTLSWEDITTADKFAAMHTFPNVTGVDENYEIRYIGFNTMGCSDTALTTITVFADLTPVFTIDPASHTLTLPNRTFTIVNETVAGNWDFYWDFGDGTTSTLRDPGSHTYATYGAYDITLTVTGNNCTERHTETVYIEAITPIVDFEYDPGVGCRPLRVNFTDKSLWTDPSTYHWDFGDGGTSTAQNPSYTYNEPGVYTVTLSATNTTNNVVSERKEFIIEVFENPRAIFQIRPDRVFLPGKPVYTANSSIDAISYLWDFGDGHTSDQFEPTHIYTQLGVFDVSLTVTNIHGCTDTYVLKKAVTVEEGGELRVPNAFTPNPDGPSNGNTGTAGVNDLFMPISEGVTEFNMMIFNRWGELLFESKSMAEGWDGYHKGKICKSDVYVYKIYVKFSDGQILTRMGDVTLLR